MGNNKLVMKYILIMFATYDHSKFPEVKVTFHGNITTEKKEKLLTYLITIS